MSEYTQEDQFIDEMSEEIVELCEDVYQDEMNKVVQLLCTVIQEKYGFTFETTNKFIDIWEEQYDRH
jgi:hypothetical protein